MLKEIFWFELRYRITRPATYIYFLIFFLLSYMGIAWDNLSIGGTSEKVFKNAPIVIYNYLCILSIFGTMVSSAVMGVPIFRDKEHKTDNYFFSFPISENGYLLGRFLGSFIVLFFIFLSIHLGIFLGSTLGPVFGSIEAERVGAFNFMHYLQPTLLLLIPNLLFTGTIFFALVALTRNIFAAYAGGLLLFVAYLLSSELASDLEYKTLVDILDPFALNTMQNATKYWTVSEQNELLIPFAGNMMWNRILWVGFSLALLVTTLVRFDFRRFLAGSPKKEKASKGEVTTSAVPVSLPKVAQQFTTGAYLQQMWQLAKMEFRNVVTDVYFIAIMGGAVIFLFIDNWFGNPTYGTPSLPLTYYMLETKDNNYVIFVFIIIIFYTGEMVAREKTLKFSNISDAFPVPNWLPYASKFLALAKICIVLATSVMVVGVINQALHGYFNFEFGMYFTELYLLTFPFYLQLAALAFIVHILVNQKFLGHFIVIAIWVGLIGLRIGGINYRMFHFGSTPDYIISSMNGFGHFMEGQFWFNLYWIGLSMLLLVIGNLFWNRGIETGLKNRLKMAKDRLRQPAVLGLVAAALVWAGAGSVVYYNISVLNNYRHVDTVRDAQAEFEKSYKHLERVLQPKIVDVKLYADLVPEERHLVARTVSLMTNKGNQPIDTLYINAPATLKSLKINGKELAPIYRDSLMTRHPVEDADGQPAVRGFAWYLLQPALAPGDTVEMEVLMETKPKGFANGGISREVVYNGTFVGGALPSFGYPGDMLNSDKERKKRDLPEKKYSQPPQDDEWGLNNLLFNDDADYITFEAFLSTAPDQIAISPGYLQREWEEGGKRYFHYRMDAEMDLFFNIVSARYEVARDVWKGPDGREIRIEIYYHPGHDRNLDRFISSVKASMDYFNKNFTPYQYDQMRILEFPRYASFAQSFPNTVPYSEAFGWVGDFSDPDNTDYAFYVTSHEVAHQWWGHQVTPSNTRGANQLSESLAEYSALMVMKNEYGENAMQKFLRYALDRYLVGRSYESKFEETLLNNDTRSYVWYQKGSMVMYALADYIGEEALNRGLKNFLDTAAFRPTGPFATTGEFLPYLYDVTPDSLKYYVEDSWEKICLYENRAMEASYEKLADDNYKVTMKVNTKKIYYDGLGKEISEGQGPDLIELGIFAEDTKNDQKMTVKAPLYLQKHWLAPGEHTLEFTVKEKPVRAGIDPYNKLIDRVSDDNLIRVEEK
jgi:ABC-2 type transport system permease protein